jgi:hypothetical protein
MGKFAERLQTRMETVLTICRVDGFISRNLQFKAPVAWIRAHCQFEQDLAGQKAIQRKGAGKTED